MDLSGEEAAKVVRFLSESAASEAGSLSSKEVGAIDCLLGNEDAIWVRFARLLNHADVSAGLAKIVRSDGGLVLAEFHRPSWAEDPAAFIDLRCDSGQGPPLWPQ